LLLKFLKIIFIFELYLKKFLEKQILQNGILSRPASQNIRK